MHNEVNKIKLVLLMGGPSSEHEVSLKTGEMISKALNKNKYDVTSVLISKDCRWVFGNPSTGSGQTLDEKSAIKKLKEDGTQVVFMAMHGEYGEDGTVQKLLEEAGITFTGSSSKASALGMDKVLSSEVLSQAGVLVPEYIVLSKGEKGGLAHGLKYPLVVKPADRGSSVGVSIVNDDEQFLSGIAEAFKYSDKVMVQAFIKGRELT